MKPARLRMQAGPRGILSTKFKSMENIKLTVKTTIVFALFILVSSCATKKELTGLKEVRSTEEVSYQALEKDVSLLKTELQSTKKWNAELREINAELTTRLRAAKASLCQISGQATECPADYRQGVVFKVQIGAFKDNELPEDPITPIIILDTEDKDNIQKIVLGQFRDYGKAEILKSHLKNMGIKDAWVVSYKDGIRVPIKTILSELEKKP